ncbi:MAG TPA: hypothetical protein VGP93_10230 [Polyangiaceae bacterium]|nr:hypothetical protein [Polyangiaceae bacterium]
MPTVDADRHEVRFRIAVIGGASERFVEPLHLKQGELELGEVQGYRPRFAFETFPHDPWGGDGSKGTVLEELVPYLDALVLTDSLDAGMHYSSGALERLRKLLTPGKIRVPAAIFGGPALIEEWQSLSGVPAVYAAEPSEDHALPAMKALVRALLGSNMRSTPPPPGAH